MSTFSVYSPAGDDVTIGAEAETTSTNILIVDDNPVDRRLAGSLLAKCPRWRLIYAAHGREALAVLEDGEIGAVLTDLQMPEMDGLELVAAVRRTHPFVPVVLMTACGSEELALRALRTGAASFVPKKDLARDLSATLEQVLAVANTGSGPHRLFAYLMVAESQFVLDNDPALVLALVVHYQEALTRLQLCDATSRIRVGIALQEALRNGLYHGNLELGPDLHQDGGKTYALLAEERRHQRPYRERRLHVGAKLSRQEARFVIRDEGPGFEVSTLLDPAHPANLGQGRGRGLLLIRTFMDEVSHTLSGHQITLVKRRDP